MTKDNDKASPETDAESGGNESGQTSAKDEPEAKEAVGLTTEKGAAESAVRHSKQDDPKGEKTGPAAKQPATDNAAAGDKLKAKTKGETTIPGISPQSYAKLEKSAASAIATAQEAMVTLEKTAGEISEKVKGVAAQYESETVPGTPATDRQMRLGHIAYLLFALGPITGVSLLFGLFLCRLRLRSDSIGGTVLHSHFRWLTGTFVFGVIGAVAAVISAWTLGDLIGLAALLTVLIWFAYRIVKGWLSLYDGKDIASPRALW